MSGRRDYYLLLGAQTLGAFGDNACRAIILGQLTFQRAAGAITETQLQTANALYTSVLFVPYVLLAPLAGFVNDRYPKTRWLFGANAIKLGGALLALLGLALGLNWQGAGYLVIGIGACLYSPAKYGILPEILPRERLVKANGTMEMLTLVAILAGNIVGAMLIDRLPAGTCYLALLAVYGAALALNLLMRTTPAHPETKLAATLRDFGGQLRSLLGSPRLSRVLFGTVLFWVAGAVMQMNFQPWGLTILGLGSEQPLTLLGQAFVLGPNQRIALLGLWLSVGIAAGSVLAGQLYPVGVLGASQRWGRLLAMLVAGLVFVAAPLPVAAMLLAVGLAAGLYLIPLNAALQGESHRGALGKTIAIQNFIENLGMLVGGGLVLAGSAVFDPLGVFVGLAVFLAVAVAFLRIPPLTPALSPVGGEGEKKGTAAPGGMAARRPDGPAGNGVAAR